MPGLQGAIAQEWLRLDGRKRIVLNDDAELRWISPAASDALGPANGLWIENGRLVAGDAADQAVLARLLESPAPHETAAIGRVDEAYFVLRRWRVPEPRGERLHLIEFNTAGHGWSGELVGLDHAFGLTPTEAMVVRELVAGRAVDALSVRLAISRETVRTHIRRIYAKTAVKSREELFARLRPFVFG